MPSFRCDRTTALRPGDCSKIPLQFSLPTAATAASRSETTKKNMFISSLLAPMLSAISNTSIPCILQSATCWGWPSGFLCAKAVKGGGSTRCTSLVSESQVSSGQISSFRMPVTAHACGSAGAAAGGAVPGACTRYVKPLTSTSSLPAARGTSASTVQRSTPRAEPPTRWKPTPPMLQLPSASTAKPALLQDSGASPTSTETILGVGHR
mmetsp:Transcript_21963/g.65995  ORF Transcript_21963/g.65995 Transcript_21963/m.65995 type:complete len:209 (+) Transcript_21963:137-763(+)